MKVREQREQAEAKAEDMDRTLLTIISELKTGCEQREQAEAKAEDIKSQSFEAKLENARERINQRRGGYGVDLTEPMDRTLLTIISELKTGCEHPDTEQHFEALVRLESLANDYYYECEDTRGPGSYPACEGMSDWESESIPKNKLCPSCGKPMAKFYNNIVETLGFIVLEDSPYMDEHYRGKGAGYALRDAKAWINYDAELKRLKMNRRKRKERTKI